MKNQLKGFIIGVLFTLIIITSISVFAIQTSKNAVLNYNDIKICIDGNYITPKDAAGNTVEPFIVEGTTYLPVRAIATALGKEVEWDAQTSTVFLGKKPDSAVANGTRTAPYDASGTASFFYNELVTYPVQEIKLKTNKIIKGNAANELIKNNPGYKAPTDSQEWVIFDVTMNYISSSKGEDSELPTYMVLKSETLYKPDGSQIICHNNSVFAGKNLGVNNLVKLYPGGSSRVVHAVLLDKYNGDILLKVKNDKEKTNTWININKDVSTITTVSELNSYLQSLGLL